MKEQHQKDSREFNLGSQSWKCLLAIHPVFKGDRQYAMQKVIFSVNIVAMLI